MYYQSILLISHEMSYTGAPRSLLNIAKVLKPLYKEITVWTIKDGEFKKEYEKEGITVEILPETIDKALIAKFQIVIVNTFFSAHIVKDIQHLTRTILYIREAQNIPYLVSQCGLSVMDIKEAKEVICVSEYAERYIKENCCPKRLSVIHNYVPDKFRGKWNIVRKGIIHFMISGTYEERKGYDIVIDAFLMMPEELKKITQLHLVGPMPEWSKQYWEELRNKYDNRIIEHGLIADEEERLKLYEKMNVFIIASRDEACSLVALEGAMLGKALLMSENTGAKYLDKKKKGLFQTEDSRVLCRKMCELTSRRELLFRGIQMRFSYLKTSTLKKYKKNLLKYLNKEGI